MFGEYQISHQQEWGYSCKKDGIEIWKFSGRGYLYTEIFKRSDQIYFGTAGLGGYFYILNINTGNPILKLRTGGTTVIKQCGDYVYLYTDVGRKKSGLACVNLSDGKILEDIELPGAASIDSVLEVYENKAYTITFQYKNNAVEHAVHNKGSGLCLRRPRNPLFSDLHQRHGQPGDLLLHYQSSG